DPCEHGAEGRRSRAHWTAAVHWGNENRIHPPARSDPGSAEENSRPHLCEAGRRFLRVSQRNGLFRGSRHQLGGGSIAAFVARSLRGHRPRRSLRHARAHPPLLRDFVRRNQAWAGEDAGVVRQALVFATDLSSGGSPTRRVLAWRGVGTTALLVFDSKIFESHPSHRLLTDLHV